VKRQDLTIRPYDTIPEWDHFVATHSQGSILHTSAMIRCQMETKQHVPHAYGVLDAAGELCAVLVAVRVSTISGLASSIASRSVMYAEPLCRNDQVGLEGVRALVQQHDREMQNQAVFSEVRPIFDCGRIHDIFVECGYQRCGYINYEVSLQGSEAELFRRMSRKRRHNVRAAIRKGVTIRSMSLAEGLGDFYDLVAKSYGHAQVPVVDQSLFQSVVRRVPTSAVRLLIAYYGGLPVSTGCFLVYNKRVLCWYAGTHRLSGVYSMPLLFWEAIRQFSREGHEIMDLAGGGWEGEDYGVGKFKEKFGGACTNHGRYRKIYSRWKLKAAETAYSVLRGWVAPWASIAASLRRI
jgi:lipid II:glycine glycyltransferase (peptidoglycan interpeptide bridge formation enzyme)